MHCFSDSPALLLFMSLNSFVAFSTRIWFVVQDVLPSICLFAHMVSDKNRAYFAISLLTFCSLIRDQLKR